MENRCFSKIVRIKNELERIISRMLLFSIANFNIVIASILLSKSILQQVLYIYNLVYMLNIYNNIILTMLPIYSDTMLLTEQIFN